MKKEMKSNGTYEVDVCDKCGDRINLDPGNWCEDRGGHCDFCGRDLHVQCNGGKWIGKNRAVEYTKRASFDGHPQSWDDLLYFGVCEDCLAACEAGTMDAEKARRIKAFKRLERQMFNVLVRLETLRSRANVLQAATHKYGFLYGHDLRLKAEHTYDGVARNMDRIMPQGPCGYRHWSRMCWRMREIKVHGNWGIGKDSLGRAPIVCHDCPLWLEEATKPDAPEYEE